MSTETLITDLHNIEPVIRFEAADKIEQVSRRNPAELFPYRQELLDIARDSDQPGVQWHLAEVLPRIGLSVEESGEAMYILERWLSQSPSSVVKADTLSAVVAIAHIHDVYMNRTKFLLARSLRYGSAAEQARVRRLLGRSGQGEP